MLKEQQQRLEKEQQRRLQKEKDSGIPSPIPDWLLPKEQQQRQKLQLLQTELQALQVHHQQRVIDESSFDMSNDKTEVIYGKSRRVRYRDELEIEAAAPTTLQDSRLRKISSNEQAKIVKISSVLSSCVESGITGKELARQVLGAYGLDENSIDRIIDRTPKTGRQIHVKPYIRASPCWNINKS